MLFLIVTEITVENIECYHNILKLKLLTKNLGYCNGKHNGEMYCTNSFQKKKSQAAYNIPCKEICIVFSFDIDVTICC